MINNQNSMKDVYSLTSIHFLMFLSQSIRFCLEKRVLVKLDFGRQVSPLGFIDLSNILFAHFSPNFRHGVFDEKIFDEKNRCRHIMLLVLHLFILASLNSCSEPDTPTEGTTVTATETTSTASTLPYDDAQLYFLSNV